MSTKVSDEPVTHKPIEEQSDVTIRFAGDSGDGMQLTGTQFTTRILMNPATMIGGYAQFSYYINYWGTSPSERDHGVIIRKMPLGAENKPIYQERDLDKLPTK